MSTKQKTVLTEHYRSIRRELIKQLSPSYISLYDAAVNRVFEWRGRIATSDIDDRWISDFESYLAQADLPPKSQNQLGLCVQHIVRREDPYRFSTRMLWRDIEPHLRAQSPDELGHYYVTVHEPSLPAGTSQRKHLRTAVWSMHIWRGGPVRLDEITNQELASFEQARVESGTSPSQAHQLVRFVRQVVNAWQPGTISRAYDPPPPPATPDGTVQRYAETDFIPARKFVDKQLLQFRRTMRLFHEFCNGNGLPFPKFTDELCAEFLQWRLKHGGRGITVNERDRFHLVSLSKHAAAAGRMKRRLFLEPVGPVRRLRKGSTNDHAKRTPASGAKNWNKGGRPKKWAHLKECVAEYLAQQPGTNEADIRARYKADHPGRPLPRPKSSTLRVYISELRPKP